MQLKAVLDYLFIEEVEQATKSGIVLPQSVTHEWVVGRITDAGPGKASSTGDIIPLPYKVGDLVLFSGNKAMEIKVGDVEVKMISAGMVFARVEE